MRKLCGVILIFSMVLMALAAGTPVLAAETTGGTGSGAENPVLDRDRIQDMTGCGTQPMIQERDQDRVQALTEAQLLFRSQLRAQLLLSSETQLQLQERLEQAHRIQVGDQPENAYRQHFSDIEEHWAREHIRWAYLWGLVNGYPDGSFKPQGNITALEGVFMVSHLVRDLKGIEPYTALDMEIDWTVIPEWAREALREQTALRIMNQTQTYDQSPLNRYQIAVMLAKALELQKSEGPGAGVPFSDFEQIPGEGRGYVLALWNLGLIAGDNGKFEPERLVTRAEAAAMLMNVIDLLDVTPPEFVVSEDWKTLTLTLEENPSTGYSWGYSLSVEGILALESDAYVAGETSENVVGAGGHHTWTFKVFEQGCVRLTFQYYRPWEAPETAVETRIYAVNVGEDGLVESVRRIQ
ncbi:protease inhibitor I42 family protein [Acidaminobacter hydrogenoformans]|uniref:Predicted secreted protein n=1 Tax=Acidaminobacter hydrogenoformans DSM 2784 TaxID=1120920 RepID=A0A1G5S2J3_9FIRM|nr:protease inhibitor I42 family protein [Acidaminobacter hydrogenoformans]SCZ79789.1 Predicted secreted protein [Acidaminobacter hydrogenoformans DSM 2784]